MAWDKEQDYHYCKSLDATHWAWEFIRRHPKYIQEWEEALRHRLASAENQPLLKIIQNNQYTLAPHLPNLLDSVSDDFAIPFLRPYNHWYLSFYHRPDNPTPKGLRFKSMGVTPYPSCTDSDDMMVTAYSKEALIAFDLRLPISHLITEAEEHLKVMQKEFENEGNFVKRNKPHEICKITAIRFLRLLDALQAGTTRKDGAAIIFNGYNNDRTPEEVWDDFNERRISYLEESYLNQIMLLNVDNSTEYKKQAKKWLRKLKNKG